MSPSHVLSPSINKNWRFNSHNKFMKIGLITFILNLLAIFAHAQESGAKEKIIGSIRAAGDMMGRAATEIKKGADSNIENGRRIWPKPKIEPSQDKPLKDKSLWELQCEKQNGTIAKNNGCLCKDGHFIDPFFLDCDTDVYHIALYQDPNTFQLPDVSIPRNVTRQAFSKCLRQNGHYHYGSENCVCPNGEATYDGECPGVELKHIMTFREHEDKQIIELIQAFSKDGWASAPNRFEIALLYNNYYSYYNSIVVDFPQTETKKTYSDSGRLIFALIALAERANLSFNVEKKVVSDYLLKFKSDDQQYPVIDKSIDQIFPHYSHELTCYRMLAQDARNRSYSDFFPMAEREFLIVPKKRLGKAGFYVYTLHTAFHVPYPKEFCESTESLTNFRIEFTESELQEKALMAMDLSVNPKTYDHRIAVTGPDAKSLESFRHCSNISKVSLAGFNATDRHSDQTLYEVLITMLNSAPNHGQDVRACRELSHTGLQYALREFDKRKSATQRQP